MATGVGIDLLEIERMERALERHPRLAERVFTEAEETCVVYGMPRSVAEAGLSDRSVPLDRMAEAILGAL